MNEDQFASVIGKLSCFGTSRCAMIATKIICLSDVVSDGSSLGKADLWHGFAGSRKTAAETFRDKLRPAQPARQREETPWKSMPIRSL
jgi:hypothetical protein